MRRIRVKRAIRKLERMIVAGEGIFGAGLVSWFIFNYVGSRAGMNIAVIIAGTAGLLTLIADNIKNDLVIAASED